MSYMKGSESMFECRFCGKQLFFIETKRAPKGCLLLKAEDVILHAPDARSASKAGLSYFHPTMEETEACHYALMLTRGARA